MNSLEEKIMGKESNSKYKNITRRYPEYINLNPLQTGSKLTEEAKKVLVEFGDGYSICDYCEGRLDQIKTPPVYDFFYKDLPKFLGSDVARPTHGAREGKYMVMHALAKSGDNIIVDGNRHYSTDVAAERVGLNIVPTKVSKGKEKKIDVEEYIPLIKKHNPKLILLTYPDGKYGNLPDAKRLGEIAKKYDVPYIINGAYSVGRMPIKMDKLNADFIVGSGHKSMAACGPIGVIGMKEKWSNKVLKTSPQHPNKEVECLGCTVRGAPLLTLMASFPHVKKRVTKWGKEVKKARWFSDMLEMASFEQLGERPHNHDLMQFRTDIFYEISKLHPKKRSFIYEELKNKGIKGIQQGRTKKIKLSTYMIPKNDLKKVLNTFEDLVDTF